MNIFTNKDIKNLFITIGLICLSLFLLIQLSLGYFPDTSGFIVAVLSVLACVSILAACFMFFRKQERAIDYALVQINRFLSGDTDVRISCDSEGNLYKLFHAINSLAASLSSHASNEQRTKEFLKDTISDISHQLKTPLSALCVYNSIIQDEETESDSIREFASKSEKEIDRLETLVQNLLKLTRLDAGSIIIEKKSEKIADMMDVACQRFEYRTHAEHKTLELSGPAGTVLCCDRDWIIEAVANLIKNSLDHTSQGCHISVEWRSLPAVTQITVRDDGCGIHPEDIHHIFKRFYRSRFSKDKQGAGLGLPLTKSIVEAHGGSITVDSTLGRGSSFVMSFLNLTEL